MFSTPPSLKYLCLLMYIYSPAVQMPNLQYQAVAVLAGSWPDVPFPTLLPGHTLRRLSRVRKYESSILYLWFEKFYGDNKHINFYPIYAHKVLYFTEYINRDEDPTFFLTDPFPAQLGKNPDPTLNRNEEKNIFIFR